MAIPFQTLSERGSLWHRWDPHLHTPGTALNDQYLGPEAWERFLSQIELTDPPIRALGITDYFSVERYQQVVEHKVAGRLPGVGFIFPNVELRLDISTAKGSGVNLHLLFDSQAANCITEINHFLLDLSFTYLDRKYRCQPSDLIKLGRAHRPDITDDKAARTIGANQFKVNFKELRTAWEAKAWIRAHALVAVAVGEKDGTSGLRDESDSFAAHRKDIEGFAHIIFSGSPKQAEFWAGKGKITAEQLPKEWKGPKPCLHGSDAHTSERVGAPDLERRCWIKGDLAFESLRQACIEPESRVYIGPDAPRHALASNTIDALSMSDAPWFAQQRLELNPGFVAIIGARGSGKTALADLLAVGGLGLQGHVSDKSFIHRARDLLGDASASLQWDSGETTRNYLTGSGNEDLLDEPHVQYLSQQFVDQLCNSDGIERPLAREIEKVIFNAHAIDDRLGANGFDELLELKLEFAHQKRDRQREALDAASEALSIERAKKESLPTLNKEFDEKSRQLARDKKDRDSLIGKGKEQRAAQYQKVLAAADAKRLAVERVKRRLQAVKLLRDDVKDYRERVAPALLSAWKEKRVDSNFTDLDWAEFSIDFVGPVDELIQARLEQAAVELGRLQGQTAVRYEQDNEADPLVSLVPEDAQLSDQTLELLEREKKRLEALVGVDLDKTKRYAALSQKMTQTEAARKTISAQLERAKLADPRIKELLSKRKAAYQGVFEAIIEEEIELRSLYEPIKQRIDAGKGSLSNLSLSVRRIIDLEGWTSDGEKLLDLRTGPFRGKGGLYTKAKEALFPAWSAGDAATAAGAVFNFWRENDLSAHMPENTDPSTWNSAIAAWLFSTAHITVS